MNHYEVTFIIDPVLSGDEIKSTARTYETLLKDQGCSIVHINEMGLKQLAYPINKKSSGVYYCIEFTSPNGSPIAKTELSLRRDERIMRFLTARLDKYGIKYNEDRRIGKISAYKKKEKAKKPFEGAAPATPVTPAAPVAAPVVAEEIQAQPVVETPAAPVAAPVVAEEIQAQPVVETPAAPVAAPVVAEEIVAQPVVETPIVAAPVVAEEIVAPQTVDVAPIANQEEE